MRVVGVLGESVTLEFVLERATPPVTRDGIMWQFKSDPLENARASFSADLLSVNISQLEYADEGEYTFIASTAAGTGSDNILLDIQGNMCYVPHIHR